MKYIFRILALVALLLCSATIAEAVAGRFKVRFVELQEVDLSSTRSVEVHGSAVYRGQREAAATKSCLITSLNRDQDGTDDLTTVLEFPITSDQPDKTGVVVFRNPPELRSGFTLTCPDPGTGFDCGARLSIPHCSEQASSDLMPIKYQGGVSVYRGTCTIVGADSRKEDSRFSDVGETTCGYTVGGSVEGLEAGDSVTIQGKFRDGLQGPIVSSQSVTVERTNGNFDGVFEFENPVRSGLDYEIEVTSQSGGGLRCSVDPDSATGVVSNQDIEDIRVVCKYICHSANQVVPIGGNYRVAYDEATCYPLDEPQHCNAPQFSRSESGFTVADTANNLLWTWDFLANFAYDRQTARSLCAGLTLDGRSDWRLPDISQLKTLLPDCGGGVFANCNQDPHPAPGPDYWSNSIAPYPNDCPSFGTCARCAFHSCGWLVRFASEEGLTGCGNNPVWFHRTEWGALTRCVTDLVP